MDGFFNVFKPTGWTSFDVVASLRRPLGTKRIGHAGTLDPTATGVLPIAVGFATRLIEYLVDGDKEYVGDIQLGSTTDTYDAAGEETSRQDWTHLTEAEVRAVLPAFTGAILQTPPAYSAVKIAGQPAYKRVRRGEEIIMQPRPAVVHELELTRFEPPLVGLRVVCGKGTYVRSLAHDLGQALGCGAHLRSLTRSRVGNLRAEQAIGVEELRQEGLNGFASEHLIAPDNVLHDLDAAVLAAGTATEISQGRTVRLYPGLPAALGRRLPLGRKSRAYCADGRFLALLEYAGPPALWKAKKVFSHV